MIAGLSPAAATAGSKWILHFRLWICMNCVGSAFWNGFTMRTFASMWSRRYLRFSHRNLVYVPHVCGSQRAYHGSCVLVFWLRATFWRDVRSRWGKRINHLTIWTVLRAANTGFSNHVGLKQCTIVLWRNSRKCKVLSYTPRNRCTSSWMIEIEWRKELDTCVVKLDEDEWMKVWRLKMVDIFCEWHRKIR